MLGISKEMVMFQRLLEQVTAKFLENHRANPNISLWKGQEIIDFQEDLRQQVQGSISEKWFYTYIKGNPEKLPRIDILNLLSNYVGQASWYAFNEQYTDKKAIMAKGAKLRWGIMTLAVVGVALAIFAVVPKKNTFHFCFIDKDNKEAITDTRIDVIVLDQEESPSYQKSDSLGCFSYTTTEDHIRFIAQSPYYKTDTIYKSVSGNKHHQVHLRTDDYALMLHYYGSNNVKDWRKRRRELEKLIAQDAVIFEILPHQIGVELYEKDEFINKLTTPTKSLQQLQVIETQYRNEQIVMLKFKIEEQ